MHNERQRQVIGLFAVSEGRVSRQTIISVGNKEILYRMLHQGYIRETTKGSGYYKATPKLKTFTEENIGKSYNVGCSNKHSAIMSRTATQMIPNTVIADGRFTGQNEIKARTEKFKHTSQYRQGLRILRDKVHKDYRDCSNRYNNSVSHKQLLDARKDLEVAAMKQAVVDSDNPLFTPDLEFTLTRAETEELLANVKRCVEDSDGREYALMLDNEAKLERMLGTSEQQFTIGAEIVTENYGNIELYRHQVFEILTGEQVLYFC